MSRACWTYSENKHLKMKSWMHLSVICLASISLEVVTSLELSDFLWQNTMSLHEAALGSPFIRGLEKISLDPTNFGAFMVQESVLCYDVKESLDLAAARVNDTSLKLFLQAKSSSYEKYYQALFNAWHISNATGIQIGSACAGYIGHVQKVSEELDPIYLVVALIPCLRLWPWLGGEINAKTGNFGVYKSWVKENLNPDNHDYKEFEDVINAAYKEGHIKEFEAFEVYTRSMKGEVDFFSSV